MSGYRLSPKARADLADIWDYGAERWGENQAERYTRVLTSAFADLAAGHRIGQPIDEVRPGYLRHRVGSHVVFFRRADAATIDVIRILHARMDIDRHL